MANRGVGTDRVVETLTGHLKDADEDSRRWAVEGLALSGATETIEPLLQTMHDDASPNVRERAACSLAESGMFTLEQRMRAVPRLLSYTDDPSLDARTHAWAFQALSDITHQHFGNDASAWRNWYNSTQRLIELGNSLNAVIVFAAPEWLVSAPSLSGNPAARELRVEAPWEN